MHLAEDGVRKILVGVGVRLRRRGIRTGAGLGWKFRADDHRLRPIGSSLGKGRSNIS